MPLYQDTQVNMVDLILLGEHREIKNVFLSSSWTNRFFSLDEIFFNSEVF